MVRCLAIFFWILSTRYPVSPALARQYMSLAIFFWILYALATLLIVARLLRLTCYFLLNFVLVDGGERYAYIAIGTLAIFFWILFVRRPTAPAVVYHVALAIFFWILWVLYSRFKSMVVWSCYFLLNFVTLRHLVLVVTQTSYLLFSFEFCRRRRDRRNVGGGAEEGQDLLFSFEFCFRRRGMLSRPPICCSCYFLLNFVLPPVHRWAISTLYALAIFFWILCATTRSKG